jgi:DMSO/TMAO reductase YedYZ molybdopterin-dependent catalytic subunit
MSTNTQLTQATTVRRIGSWGTVSRLVLGGLFIYWALRRGVSWDDAFIGFVVFPAAVSLALGLRGPDARPPLRLVGPGGYALNILIWVVAINLAPVPTLLFGGATQILAAARGYAGCELFAISNWLTQRDDQIGCPVHSCVDAAEAEAKGRQSQEAF